MTSTAGHQFIQSALSTQQYIEQCVSFCVFLYEQGCLHIYPGMFYVSSVFLFTYVYRW